MKLTKREKEDKTELDHNDLLKVIRDEFEEEISRGEQRIIQLRVSKKVYNIMSEYLGENVMEYNIKQRKLFSSIYRDLKRKFGVASYKDIKVVEYEKALNFIENWIEDKDVI